MSSILSFFFKDVSRVRDAVPQREAQGVQPVPRVRVRRNLGAGAGHPWDQQGAETAQLGIVAEATPPAPRPRNRGRC